MARTSAEQNKALVLEAFDALFNRRDYVAAERYWSDRYIQHSAHIEPGREGLFNLVRSLPDMLRYENQLILAEGDYVIAHGRFSGHGRPAAWIAADIVRFEDGKLAEQVLSSRTRGLVGAKELALMKPTARLVNTSRGPIVIEADLIAVLESGKIAGAALDVFDQEPLPPDHPFRSLPNLLATPHIGYVSRDLYQRFYQDTVDNIRLWLDR
jgi:predicted SnoaL-like aldol condensation-catalyzing enzyme